MEKGFYHPDRGYWQTTEEPPQDILDGYPEGTIPFELQPSNEHQIIDGQWVHVPPAADELAAARLTAIKDECRRRIYTVASAETQMNMTAAAAMISAKPADERTAADLAVLAGQAASLQWVAAMRANVAALFAEPEADIATDASWPACPPEALALVNQF